MRVRENPYTDNERRCADPEAAAVWEIAAQLERQGHYDWAATLERACDAMWACWSDRELFREDAERIKKRAEALGDAASHMEGELDAARRELDATQRVMTAALAAPMVVTPPEVTYLIVGTVPCPTCRGTGSLADPLGGHRRCDECDAVGYQGVNAAGRLVPLTKDTGP